MQPFDAMSLARAFGLALALAGATSAPAQTVRTVQDTTLRTERGVDAGALAALPAHASVTLLQLDGGWAQVQTQAGGRSRRGWLRASLLALHPPEVASASQLETGRRAGAHSTVMLGVRSLPPRGNRHALIIGIGSYRVDPARPVAALAGVAHDMLSALAMARALQVPNDHITLLRDEAATHTGIAVAIRQLGERVAPGDRVFVYWSGHGSRYFDAAADGCVESLVPHDLVDVTNRQLAHWLEPIGKQADKMLVVYDACHAGGIAVAAPGAATRSLAGGLQAKSTPGPKTCQTPSNLRTRSLAGAAAALGMSGQDVVHISSSRPDEVSLDDPLGGGLATRALRQCLLGDARDADASGSVSAQELADCAQAKVEQALAGNAQFNPPHFTLSGNRNFVPAWFANAVAATAAAATPLPLPLPLPAAGLAIPRLPLPPAAAVDSPVPLGRVLEQIHAQRDGKRTVSLSTAPARLRIGADALTFRVTSSHAGHVYVALLGSDGQSLYLLFPNALDAANTVQAGQTLTLPRANWRITAGGPPGIDKLLVLVADGPRDLSQLRVGQAGPFVQPLTDAQGRAQLQWLFATNAQPHAAGECASQACSDAFGSALVDIEEY